MIKIGRGAEAPPFLVMDVIAAANARVAALPPGAPKVIRMEVGQPGTGAPQGAVDAAAAALRGGGSLGYTEALGRPSLRARIARHYMEWYGLKLPPNRIAVTMGASGAFPLAFLAAFDPGDRVALAAPFYPPYVNILTSLGLQPVVVETGPETRYQPTIAALERLDPLPDGLIVASPCNPAGTMLAPDELQALAAWCDANGVRLISDEIYHGLHYSRPIATAAAYSPHAIVINSFSKYFSMTGWRVGWMVLPEALVRPVECLAQNMFISAAHISQIAAEAAFDCAAELDGNVARYRRSRDRLLTALPEAGFPDVAAADGAFYIYADIGARTNDSMGFCARMLEDAGIAASAGVDFDRARGHRTMRFSYCGPEADMAEAAERLRHWRG
ncbi:MAG: pyridoxal phosphate-dependent aminotransferase [Janthinobacterium lividum]